MSAVGVHVDGSNRLLPAVGDGRLVDTSARIAAPGRLGAGENERTGDLALFQKPQPRLLKE